MISSQFGIYVNVWCNMNVTLDSLSLNIIIFLTEGSKHIWLIFWTDVAAEFEKNNNKNVLYTLNNQWSD